MASISKPYTFEDETTAEAYEVNANFDTLYQWVNTQGIHKDASVAFEQIPSGPNADPTAANQFTRKAYVDGLVGVAGSVSITTNQQFNYGQGFVSGGLFTVPRTSLLRASLTACVSHLQQHQMRLRVTLYRWTGTSNEAVTTALVVVVPHGSRVLAAGTGQWIEVPPGTYRFGGTVDAVSIPSGAVLFDGQGTNVLSWEGKGKLA